MPFAEMWVDLEMIILSKVSQKKKDKQSKSEKERQERQVSYGIAYMWNLTNKPIYDTEVD